MLLLQKMVRDEWIKLAVITLFMSAVSVAQVILWPEVQKVFLVIQETIPDFLRWMTGGIAGEGLTFYIITQQMIKNVGVFGTALAILLGASAVAREKELGTSELLLAQPVSRTRFLVERFVFGSVALSVPILLSTILAYPAALIIGETMDPLPLLAAGVYCYSILLVVFAFSFGLGVFLDDQMRVISTALGACLLMTFLIIFDETKSFSLYGYMDIDSLRPIFRAGRIPYIETLTFLLVSGGFLGFSILAFKKKTI
jgi:ABC-type transport system involved in multi-copper enzyme maturation permease subunit